MSDEEVTYSQGVVDNLLYMNEQLRRQVSIYEKALELISHKDMNPEGVAYAAIKYARAALEEGRK